jgi:hypothetical protein
MKSPAAVAGCVLFLVACAVSDPDIYRDKFNGNNVVEIEPYKNTCEYAVACSRLGAQWRSSAPEYAALLVRVPGIVGILGLQINVDGRISTLDPIDSLTDMDTYYKWSTIRFLIPVETIRYIVHSQLTMVRIRTTGMTFDDQVVGGEDERSMAYVALKRFLAAVDDERSRMEARQSNRKSAPKGVEHQEPATTPSLRESPKATPEETTQQQEGTESPFE